LCKILNKQEIKPHKVRYYLERDYLERGDPEFKQKMAEVLCVYREVKLIKETAMTAKQEPSNAVGCQLCLRPRAAPRTPHGVVRQTKSASSYA
jgi:hypothetical protein